MSRKEFLSNRLSSVLTLWFLTTPKTLLCKKFRRFTYRRSDNVGFLFLKNSFYNVYEELNMLVRESLLELFVS